MGAREGFSKRTAACDPKEEGGRAVCTCSQDAALLPRAPLIRPFCPWLKQGFLFGISVTFYDTPGAGVDFVGLFGFVSSIHCSRIALSNLYVITLDVLPLPVRLSVPFRSGQHKGQEQQLL